MAYMSELTDKLVADVEGEPIGHLIDLIAVKRGDIQHPEIAALVVKRHRGNLLIPYENVAVLLAPAIPLNRRLQDIIPYQPTENDIYLARDVLDKQIIDTNGMRVVRVNDLELARVNGHFYIANLDIGSLGLLRRLGFARLAQNVSTRFGRKLRSATIAWHDTEMLPGDQPMRLKVPSDKITDLHPADLRRNHQRPQPNRQQQTVGNTRHQDCRRYPRRGGTRFPGQPGGRYGR